MWSAKTVSLVVKTHIFLLKWQQEYGICPFAAFLHVFNLSQMNPPPPVQVLPSLVFDSLLCLGLGTFLCALQWVSDFNQETIEREGLFFLPSHGSLLQTDHLVTAGSYTFVLYTCFYMYVCSLACWRPISKVYSNMESLVDQRPFCIISLRQVSLCSPGWCPTHDPLSLACRARRLLVCTTVSVSKPTSKLFPYVFIKRKSQPWDLENSILV